MPHHPLVADVFAAAGGNAIDLTTELDRRYAGLTTTMTVHLPVPQGAALTPGTRVRIDQFTQATPITVEAAAVVVDRPDVQLYLDLADLDQDELRHGYEQRTRSREGLLADPTPWTVEEAARVLARTPVQVRALFLNRNEPPPEFLTVGQFRRWAMRTGRMDAEGRPVIAERVSRPRLARHEQTRASAEYTGRQLGERRDV